MGEVFDGVREGCYLYSRHTNPSNSYLGQALAEIENKKALYLLPQEWLQLQLQFFSCAIVEMR